MHFLALDNDLDELRKSFFTEEEKELMVVHHHLLSLFLKLVGQIILTILVVIIGIAGVYAGLPLGDFLGVITVLWLFFVFMAMLKGYLDWTNDVLIVTTDKVILVDQTSFFQRTVTPINLENFASVTAETQLLNLFPFGKIIFNLKEGAGDKIILKYIPHHTRVAATISASVTKFQRHRSQT